MLGAYSCFVPSSRLIKNEREKVEFNLLLENNRRVSFRKETMFIINLLLLAWDLFIRFPRVRDCFVWFFLPGFPFQIYKLPSCC
jgi:hypothetical protein